MKQHLSQHPIRIWVLLCLFGLAACSRATAPVPTDASISESLKSAFYSHPELKNDRVDISVNNGEVTLSGEVSSDTARLQAYKLANETPGVKKITDLLQVKPTQAMQVPAPEAAVVVPPSPAPVSPKPAAPKPQSVSPAVPTKKPAAPPPPRVVTVPAGTNVRIQMIDSIDSGKNQPGETFLASLDAPITVESEVVVPKGADISVRLVDAKKSGKFKGQSGLVLDLESLKFQGKTYNLSSSSYEQVGKSRGKETAKRTGLGAAIGAGIGAIAGGGKGAAIGAGIGAGSGAASQLILKGKQVQVPSETKLDFELAEPVQITLKPAQSAKAAN
jgi:hypothetical protein